MADIEVNDEILQYAAMIVSRKKYWTEDIDHLLKGWQKAIHNRKEGHKKLESRYKKLYLGLGIPVVVLTFLAGSSVFSTFKNCDVEDDCSQDEWIRLASGVVSIVSGIFSGIITYINPGGVREKHKKAMDAYDSIYRIIETTIRTPTVLRGDALTVIQDIRLQFDNTVKESPSIDLSSEHTLDSSDVIVEVDANTEKTLKESTIKFDNSLLKSLSFELNRLNQ